MIKAILFDVDGVLVNGERFSNNLAKDYGIAPDVTEPFFNGPFKDCILGKADLKETIEPHLKDWGWKGTVDELLNYWFKSEHNIDEDLVEYIQDLRKRGIKCYLATNQEKYRTQYMLDKMGFAHSFDKVYASSQLGHRKPNQEFYDKIMEDLPGINKEEILFWDNAVDNVEAARQFGIKGEVYSTFEDFKQKMSDYL